MEKTYKFPAQCEQAVDNMVAVVVERYLRQQMSAPPVEEKVEYQQAVDAFRVENNMETVFTKKIEVKPIEEPIEVIEK
jgi:hypothetical protein